MTHVNYTLPEDGETLRGRRPRPQPFAHVAAVALFVALLAVFAAGSGWLLWQSYREAHANVRLRADGYSRVVAANVEWVTATARQVLHRVDDSLGSALEPMPAAEIAKLQSAVDALPGGARVYVVKPDGSTVVTTDEQFQAIDIRDRDYFKVPAAGAEWYISSLLISRLNGEQIFVISKRLEREGQFAGVAVVSFGTELMRKVWESLGMDDKSTVSLFRDDGQLVLRYPPADGPLDLRGYILFTDLLPKSDVGSYNAVSPVDGVSRVVGYRRVSGTNLVALASPSTEAAFRQFVNGALTTTLIAIPVAATLILLGFWTTRLLRRDVMRAVELGDALEKNQMLLREVHHRVKNNLQSVVSLLRMQKLPPDVERDTVARIHSMSSLHRHIYETDQFGDIEAPAFLKVIVDEAVGVYGPSAQVTYALEDYVIERDQAVGLGLVVTEVVSNACKYGATAGGDLMLKVALQKKSEREALLTIEDSGPGFDATSSKRGMGSRLVEVFSDSLGSCSYSFENGTRFSLIIKQH